MGIARVEMLGKNDLDLVPPEEAELFMANDQQVLINKEPLDIPEEPLETRFKGMRTLHTRKIPILDEQGNPQYLLGISEDITERKQAEAMLAQERNLLQTVIDTLPDSIYAKDTESRFTLANLTEIQLNGATTFEDLRGKNDFDRYPRELAEQYFAAEQPVLRRPRSHGQSSLAFVDQGSPARQSGPHRRVGGHDA
jgi:PAS domain S-box-containing protein